MGDAVLLARLGGRLSARPGEVLVVALGVSAARLGFFAFGLFRRLGLARRGGGGG